MEAIGTSVTSLSILSAPELDASVSQVPHTHTHTLPPSPSLAPSPLTQQADAMGGWARAGEGGLNACLE
jgi:hypothetical protein